MLRGAGTATTLRLSAAVTDSAIARVRSKTLGPADAQNAERNDLRAGTPCHLSCNET